MQINILFTKHNLPHLGGSLFRETFDNMRDAAKRFRELEQDNTVTAVEWGQITIPGIDSRVRAHSIASEALDQGTRDTSALYRHYAIPFGCGFVQVVARDIEEADFVTHTHPEVIALKRELSAESECASIWFGRPERMELDPRSEATGPTRQGLEFQSDTGPYLYGIY